MRAIETIFPGVLLVLLAGVGAARGDAPEIAASTEHPLEGLAIGAEFGEPSAVTVRYALPGSPLGIGAALGSGLFHGRGLQLHADVTYTVVELMNRRLPIRVGLGGRYYRHAYAPVSIDELPDTHLGVRLSFGAAYRLVQQRLEVYGELAPGYDVRRSDGCSLQSGAASLCPHAMSDHSFVQFAVGARYYF